MKLFTILFMILFMTGCSNTAVIRVVEYQGNIAALGGDACVVHQSGGENAFARVSVTYAGTSCTVEVMSDVQD